MKRKSEPKHRAPKSHCFLCILSLLKPEQIFKKGALATLEFQSLHSKYEPVEFRVSSPVMTSVPYPSGKIPKRLRNRHGRKHRLLGKSSPILGCLSAIRFNNRISSPSSAHGVKNSWDKNRNGETNAEIFSEEKLLMHRSIHSLLKIEHGF